MGATWADEDNLPFCAGADLEEAAGPVRKKRPASRTGNRVRHFAEVLR